MNEHSVQEEVLGRLTWDNRFCCWSGEVDLFPGHRVVISVSQEDTELLEALRRARGTLERIREEEVGLRHAAAEELLDLHNEEWNEGAPIDAMEFVRRMRLESIVFFPDGEADLFYQDGDLFEGHPIVVGVTSHGAFEGADITE
jgi:hypothetical protein